ncbi:MAG: 2Fe-2S iron-sulfur cluster-binding protein [Gammaproteobacteria bacterium]
MSKITLGEQVYACRPQETILDTLLRENVAIPHACKSGVCLSCVVRSLDAVPPASAQSGLQDTQKRQQYFLACQCRPQQDMHITLPGQEHFFTVGTVVEKTLLNRETILLTLECKDALDYYAGQFVSLRRADGLRRSYSIACPAAFDNKRLSFHIRRLDKGRFSEWVYRDVKIGDSLEVSEAQGSCYYTPDRSQQNILLIGTGSGLAPLFGIASDALKQGHSGAIHLFHGSRTEEGLYFVNEMRNMAENHANFHYIPCISGPRVPAGYASGRANDIALSTLSDLNGWKVFLCGHPQMIQETKKQAFLNGALIGNIYSDAFYTAASGQ